MAFAGDKNLGLVVEIKWGVGAYAVISRRASVDGPDPTAEDQEVTDLDSNATEHTATIVNYGNIKISTFWSWSDAVHKLCYDNIGDDTATVKVTYPGGENVICEGYIAGIAFGSQEPKTVKTADIDFKISGKPVYAAAAA